MYGRTPVAPCPRSNNHREIVTKQGRGPARPQDHSPLSLKCRSRSYALRRISPINTPMADPHAQVESWQGWTINKGFSKLIISDL